MILQLNARRGELVRDLEHVTDVPSKTWGETCTVDRPSEGELRRIDAALARYAAGEYGICVTCGMDIAPERLLAVPETPFCATCAR